MGFHHVSTRRIVLTTVLILGLAAAATAKADTPAKVKFQFLLFPDDLKTSTERELVVCMVNTGLENSLIEADGDHLALAIPVGAGAGDLAGPIGILGLSCLAPAGWKCSVAHTPGQSTVTFGPDGEVVVPEKTTRCFDLTGTITNSVEGLVFTEMTQSIASSRAVNPVNRLLPVFKSIDGTIKHDDLAAVMPDQHHPQVFEVIGDDIHNLNSGNVLLSPGKLGLGTSVPDARLHVQGDALFNFPGPRHLRVATPFGGMGFTGSSEDGDRRDIFFSNSGISLLTSVDASPPSTVNGLRISESGTVSIGNANAGTTVSLIPDDNGRGGAFAMRDSGSNQTVVLQAEHQHVGGRILLSHPTEPGALIQIDSNWEDSGDSRVVTNVIEITGGADLSEHFHVAGDVEPGMVVSIDTENEGRLVVSERAYDRTVAGIVSGANDVRPGMLMGQRGSAADGDHPVALSGRVYCLADTSRGEIRPGDLITTSDVPGRCMKAKNGKKAQGAVLGKAMSGVEDGMVLVLVNLQ